MQADSIKIESDEDGFYLVLQLDEEIPLVTDEGRLSVRVQNCAEALHEQVNLIIGGWLAEGQAAARMPARAIFRCDPDESGGVGEHLAESRAMEQWKEEKHAARAREEFPQWEHLIEGVQENREEGWISYDLSDPKHPDFHSVHTDHYDNREKV